MILSDTTMTVALIGAMIYATLAIGLVRADRETHTGGFITLNGMVSLLATLPVSLLLEYFGRKLNFRSNYQMTTAITCCAALTFAFVLGAIRLAEYLWNLLPAPV